MKSINFIRVKAICVLVLSLVGTCVSADISHSVNISVEYKQRYSITFEGCKLTSFSITERPYTWPSLPSTRVVDILDCPNASSAQAYGNSKGRGRFSVTKKKQAD